MSRGKFIVVAGLTAVGGAALYYAANHGFWPKETAIAAASHSGGFAMPVPVTKPVRQVVPVVLSYAARTEAIQSVTLQAKVTGYLAEQVVPDGQEVRKGDLLYKIDQRDYQAAVDQVRAQLQRDVAALDYARSNLARGSTLGKDGFLSKDTVEQRLSAVRQAEGVVAMDKAAIETAELNLANIEIRAPFHGRLGRNQASVGTLISVAGTPLNTLQQIAPLYITFSPSEGDLGRIEKARAAGDVPVEVFLGNNDVDPVEVGKLSFIDNVVDKTTGTIIARATIANEQRALLPGQYVRIRVILGQRPDVLMVPQPSIGSSQLGKYVYVVGRDNKIEQRHVELGSIVGGLVEVGKGVSADELIVTGNLQKIGPGSLVQPLPH